MMNTYASLFKNRWWLLTAFVLFLAASCNKKTETMAEPDVLYTCSMDPQVISHHPGQCPICHMELTRMPATEKGDSNSLRISDQQKLLAGIETSFAEEQTINLGQTLPAVVSVDQQNTLELASRFPGRIEKLYFRSTGEEIKKGMPLYQIYSEALLSAEKSFLLADAHMQEPASSGMNYRSLAMAARQRLQLWGLSESQILELQRNKIPGNTLTVYSQQEGIVTAINVTTGDYVDEGTSIYQVTDLSNVWVEAQLFAGTGPGIHVGDKALITFPSRIEKPVEAQVTFANPELQEDKKYLLIRMQIPNEKRKLAPGMQAIISLHGNQTETLAVPTRAVLYDEGAAWVWVKTKPGTYEPRMIGTGIGDDHYIQVLDGLEEGEAVVTSGAYLLQSEYIFRRGADPMAGMDHSTSMDGMKM